MSAGPETSHENLVERQFSPRAGDYVTSAVHARGEDLDRLAAWTREHRPARVLDLGCGGGHVSFTAASHAGQVVACDPSAAMLAAVAAEAKRRGLGNIETREGRAEQLPFDAGAFDLVVSRFSAHHWRALDPGLAEARRVLRPGGAAIFIDTASPAEALLDTWLQTIELMRDPSHVRNWSVREWTAALQAAGFDPGTPFLMRRRLEFSAWVQRMATPAAMVAAIRSLQEQMPGEARRHFEVEAEGSFWIDVLWLNG